MNTRIKILLLGASLAVLIAALWSWRQLTPKMPMPQSQAGTDPMVQQAATSGEQSSDASTPSQPTISHTHKPSPELKRAFEAINHNPIEFYGRAIDQFGEPVTGAVVTGSVLYNTGTKSGQTMISTTTDASGYFQFSGLEGQSLGVGISKSGYEYRRFNSSFWYSYFEADHKRHQPDQENPIIFLLWKKQGAESLVHYDKAWRFPVNAGPVRIDLVTGQLGGQDADLVVTISRTPLQMRYGQRGFAWKATIEVLGGGLIQAGQRDYYNLAPESGYIQHFEVTQEAQSVRDAQAEKIKWTWRESFSDDFFISSRDGQNFTRIKLRIRPNSDRKEGDNEALIAAEVWLNPNGSRNLEFDPAKAIRPTP